MNILNSLLAQQISGTVEPDPIIVDGQRASIDPIARVDPYEDFLVNNSQAVEELADNRSINEEVSQHKGLFGVKGTLRDVLGTLGDAFLVQSGNKRIFAPQRERERQGDAMAGFTRDPRAAAERMAIHNPEMAAQMMARIQAQETARAQASNTAANQLRDDQRADSIAANKQYDMFSELFAQTAGSANPETYKRMIPLLNRIKERGGLGDEFIVPDEYDKDLMTSYQYAGMKSNQQVEVPYKERRANTADRNADTARINATRPRATRSSRAPQPTMSSNIIRIQGKVDRGESLNAGEAATWNKHISSGSGRRRRTRPSTVEKPTFTIKSVR